MNKNNNNNSEQSPYEILGIKEDSNFEDIQKARDKKVEEAGEDLIAKAKIESSYDKLLMGSLKARKSGSVSYEAQNASIKENQENKAINSGLPLLSKIKDLNKGKDNNKSFNIPSIQTPSFENISTKISFSLLFIVVLLISPDSYNRILLSFSTLILTFVQIKSGKRFITSLGWSVTFLSLGFIFGGLIENNSFVQEIFNESFSVQKIESLPAMLILWIGIIFL